MRIAMAIFCFTVASACTPSVRSSPISSRADLALTHATVVDVESGRLLPDQTVLIAGDRIAGVVLNGRYLDRSELDALLVRAEAEASRK